MPPKKTPLKIDTGTLTFEKFWTWLEAHPNCITRAGTADTTLFDDDDFHWHFALEGSARLLQVIRGKRVVGELIVQPTEIAYVQCLPENQGEFIFELVVETADAHDVAYIFALSHAFDEEEEVVPGRWTH